MRSTVPIALVLLLSAAGCTDKQAPPPDVPGPPAPIEPAPAAKKKDGPIRKLQRPMLDAVMHQGPWWVLERVAIEEVVEGKKFIGWRVLEMPASWSGLELKPGDVVTQVNAMKLTRPGDFWSAWTTLSVASELKVAYLRDGEKREMSLPIEGSPDPALSHRLQSQGKAPPPRDRSGPKRRPRRKQTIVIKGEDRPLSDTRVDWTQ